MSPRPLIASRDLLFVGCNRRVAALRRDTGELVWQWKSPKGTGFVALLVDGDLLFVSIDGYTFALDPASGEVLWQNPLSGFGTGVACLATARGTTAAVSGSAAQSALSKRAEDAATP